MGRRKRHRPFVMLEKATLKSQEWKRLTKSEMITYIYIKKNYNGGNNGNIPLKYSELEGILAGATLSKALKGLIKKGWIEKVKCGGLYRYFCLYKLTKKHDRIK